jgi:hypothetical protein
MKAFYISEFNKYVATVVKSLAADNMIPAEDAGLVQKYLGTQPRTEKITTFLKAKIKAEPKLGDIDSKTFPDTVKAVVAAETNTCTADGHDVGAQILAIIGEVATNEKYIAMVKKLLTMLKNT